MASTFYARYLPPPKAPLENGTQSAATPKLSRKRAHNEADIESPTTSKKPKKSKRRFDHTEASKAEPLESAPDSTSNRKKSRSRPSENRPSDDNHQAESEVPPEEPKKHSKEKPKKSKQSGADGGPDGSGPHRTPTPTGSDPNGESTEGQEMDVEEHERNLDNVQLKTTKKKKKGPDSSHEVKVNKEADDRHGKVRERFEKSLKKSKAMAAQEPDPPEDLEDPPTEPIETHGLIPLPQPPQAPEPDKPSFTGLPFWIAHPLRVSLNDKKPFEELNINPKLLGVLKAKGYDEAFAVQTAVIPLFRKGADEYNGDICISAATGSGKTLAYVLPMIESLRDRVVTKIRGLIVVPTRELVKQVREVCELCASGTGLKICTAIGSKSLKEEQGLIVKRGQRYDPQKYQEQQGRLASSLDWSKFHLEDLLSSLDEGSDLLPGHIVEYSSKVDILICTPGRLVDHIRSTKGFNLDSVQWLIIDEADRLVNESFQEWVDVVIPALESEKPYEDMAPAQQFLSDMSFSIRKPVLRKIICSATMTRDISKLNSLRLRRPRLIVVGEADAAKRNPEDSHPGDETSTYNLPPTLKEYAITVADESLKPLYLLDLLLKHIKILESVVPTNGRKISSLDRDDPSSDSESSSDPDSDSSSGAATDTSPEISSSSNSEASSPVNASSPPARLSTTTKPTVLIFASSTSAVHRLNHLLTTLHPALSTHITTLTRTSPSRRALSSLLSPSSPIRIAIATDRASRGLDIPFLGHVISYDVPASLTAYVHRVGRTARADHEGSAWNLVSWREGKWWWSAVGKQEAEGVKRVGKVKRVKVEIEMGEDEKGRYQEALRKLGEDVRGEGK